MTSPSGAQRPAHLPTGRWLGDFAPLSAAEQKLVAACARGEACVLNAKRPEQASAENTIRAGLIRFLALGGDAENPVHERGVYLRGAWISETLDLKGCTVATDLLLFACRVVNPIMALGAHLAGLYLDGSAISGLNADRMKVSGGVFLRNGFSATGEVRLLGATIGGDLTCSEGSFTNENGKALSADGSKITGSCYFRNGFTANGEVRLLGATIGGVLDCSGGSFTNENDCALSAETCFIKSSLIVKGATIRGAINLGAARVGTLADGDAEHDGKPPLCWDRCKTD